MNNRGFLHIYCGDGKGKTTAAAGLAARAAGTGMSVAFVQFLKSGDSGELASLRKLGVEVDTGMETDGFVAFMTEKEREAVKEGCCARLSRAENMLGVFDMVVLDEILAAISTGMVSEDGVMKLVRGRKTTELVLTGRDPSPELIAAADYVSDIRCVKHPFENGVAARRGIEY